MFVSVAFFVPSSLGVYTFLTIRPKCEKKASESRFAHSIEILLLGSQRIRSCGIFVD